MNAQERVISYLKHDRTLLGGRNLYNQLPGKSLALLASFSRMSNTEANLQKLMYELAKCAQVPQRQVAILLQTPVIPLEINNIEVVAEQVSLSPQERLLRFDASTADFFESKALAKDLEIAIPKKKKELFARLTEAKEKEITAQIAAVPMPVKASIKLREQFPFLRKPDCPNALKVLVNDLITAYETYKQEQPKLHALVTQEAKKATAAVVLKNYIANKEAWEELEHYHKHNVVLGKHPLFERLGLKENISLMNAAELANKIKNLEINIGKNRKKNNTVLVERDTDLLAHAKNVLSKK